MIIKELSFSGMTSYNHRVDIPFNQGTTLIKGKNGAGKTTIYNAMKFALFGTKGLSVKKDAFRLKNKKMEVELKFEFDNETYVVSRKYGTKLKSSQKARLESTNRSPLTNPSEIDRFIIDLLGVDDLIVDQVLFVKQGEFSKVLETQPSDRKKMFEKYFNIEKYRETKRILNKAIRTISSSIEQKDLSINGLEKQIAELPEKQYEFNSIRNRLREKKVVYDKNNQALSLLKNKKTDYENKSNDLEELSNRLEQVQSEYNEVKKDDEKLNEQLDKYPELKSTPDSELRNKSKELNKKYIDLLGFKTEFDSINKRQIDLKEKLKTEKEKFDNNTVSPEIKKSVQKVLNKIDELKSLEIKIDDEEKNIVTLLEIEEKKTKFQELTKQNSLDPLAKRKSKFSNLILNGDKKALVNLNTEFESKRELYRKAIEDQEKKKERIDSDQRNLKYQISQKDEIIKKIKVASKEDHDVRCGECHTLLDKKTRDLLSKELKNEILVQEKELENLETELVLLQKEQTSTYEGFREYYSFDLILMINKEKSLVDLILDYRGCHNNYEESSKLFKENYNAMKSTIRKFGIELSENIANWSSQIYKKKSGLIKEIETYEVIKTIIAEINSLESEFIEVEHEKNSVISKLSTYNISTLEIFNKTFNEIMEEKVRYQNIVDELDKHSDNLSNIKELEKQIKKMKSDISKLTSKLEEMSIDQINQENERISEILTQVFEEMESLNQRYGSYIVDFRNIKADKLTKIQLYDEIKEAKEEIARSKTIGEIIDKYTSYLLEIRTINIENEMNDILQDLNSESGNLRVEFKSDGTKINITIPRPTALDNSPYTLSGGEKMLISYAFRIALTRVMSDLGFIFLDEPTYGLDSDRIAELAEIIQRKKQISQMFIISHEEKFKDSVDNVIDVYQSISGSVVKILK